MTTIEKLLIQGIRSFSPYKGEVIEFFQPLTLIVGPNGAGKTTVIECLRYATTGDGPPSDAAKSQQAFIHDPKVCGEKEVKAQIKLRFRTVNGTPIVANRSLQLIQHATKMEMKTLESALQTINAKGETVSQSYRCVDVDKEIPELMGVSPAILSNVIFCHQEESNWPLGEPNQLKKKFDGIFASTRYTKALEVINTQKKTLNGQIKEHKLKLEMAENNLAQANRIKKTMAETTNSMQELKEEGERLKEEISVKEKEYRALLVTKQSFEEMAMQIKNLQSSRNRENEALNNLKNQIVEEIDETKEELEERRDTFDTQVEKIKSKRNQIIQEKKAILDKKRESEQYSNSISARWGEAQGIIKSTEADIQQRNTAFFQFAQNYHLPGAPKAAQDIDEDAIQALLKKVQEMEKLIETRSTTRKSQIETQDNQLREQEEKIRRDCNDLQDQIQREKKTMQDNEKTINLLLAEIEEKKQLASQVSDVQAKIYQKKDEIERLQEGFDPKQISREISEKDQEIQSVDTILVQLNQDLNTLEKFRSLHTNLDSLRTRKAEREKEYEQLISLHEKSITKFLGKLSPPDLPTQLQRLVEKAQATRAQESKKLEGIRESVNLLKGKKGQLESTLKSLSAERDQAKKKIDGLKGNPLPQLLADLEVECSEKRASIVKLQSASILYEMFIAKGSEKNECPLCHSGINVPRFVEDLTAIINDIPDQLATEEKELKMHEKMKLKLTAFQPDWDKYARLENEEIPKIQQSLQELQRKEEELQSEVETQVSTVHGAEKTEKQIGLMIDPAKDIFRSHKETNELNERVLEAEKQLKKSTSDSRTVADVSAEIVKYQNRNNELRAEVSDLNKTLHTKNTQIVNLSQQVSKMENSLLGLRSKDDAIYSNSTKIEELKNQNSKFNIPDLQSQLKEKSEQRGEVQQTREKNRVTTTQELKGLEEEVKRFHINKAHIQNLHKKINLEEIEESRKQIGTLQEKKKACDDKIKQIDAQVQTLTDNENKIVQQLNSQETLLRNILANIQLRDQAIQIKEIEDRISKLQKDYQKSHDPGLAEKMSKLETNIAGLKTKRDKCSGAATTQLHTTTKYKDELKQDIFVNADEKYRIQLISLQTTEMAMHDLEKYHKALDQALMKYHTLKMKEINEILKELWRTTYRGNDIDAIELRAEMAETGVRKYNYRVVMIKDGVSIDMRGRCSAGQKVLASLVIRLALAETFCLNCGILALDEPTTNLDSPNIKSFADALIKYVLAHPFFMNPAVQSDTSSQAAVVMCICEEDQENRFLLPTAVCDHH